MGAHFLQIQTIATQFPIDLCEKSSFVHQRMFLNITFHPSESVLTCVRGCVGARSVNWGAERLNISLVLFCGAPSGLGALRAAALGLAQTSEAAKFLDIETVSDSSLRAPAASLTPLFWVNDVTCDLEVLTTCVPNLFFLL